jgi:hypothetical protein
LNEVNSEYDLIKISIPQNKRVIKIVMKVPTLITKEEIKIDSLFVFKIGIKYSYLNAIKIVKKDEICRNNDWTEKASGV